MAAVLAEITSAFWTDESGQDLAEFALLLAVVAVLLISMITLYSAKLQHVFDTAANAQGAGQSGGQDCVTPGHGGPPPGQGGTPPGQCRN